MAEEMSTIDLHREQGFSEGRSASYSLFILGLNVCSLAVMLGLITTHLTVFPDGILWRADFLFCMVFLADFLFTLWRTPNRADYFFRRGGWLDLLGSFPTVPGLHWTSFLRLCRLNQLVRVVKHLQGRDFDVVIAETRRTPAKTALLTMIIAVLVLVTFVSLLVLWIERGAAGAEILTGADAFWWSLVTVTTVGYGDKVPVTYLGRILALIMMIFGIGIFAVLTSYVASNLMQMQGGEENSDAAIREEIVAIREENAHIQSELVEIKDLLNYRNETV